MEHLGSMSPAFGYADISHLNEDEKRIIETVMLRQKAEEEKQADVLR